MKKIKTIVPQIEESEFTVVGTSPLLIHSSLFDNRVFRTSSINVKQAIVSCFNREIISHAKLRASFYVYGNTDLCKQDLAEIIGPTPTLVEHEHRARLEYYFKFDEWEIPLKIECMKGGLLSLDQIIDVVDLAGSSVGIGFMRPEKGGEFGKFKLKE